ncbi:DMT family transporter [Streptomyces sp. NPDC050433]|uniref:DMT family transporter n=1 Tax=unclassified Streptomyces TaxID=2593676 RepID=UPI00342120BC
MVISVLFAVLTAISNGSASVLQRRAASTVSDSHSMRLALIGHLLRQRVWLAGIALVIVAAFCQAVALATGPISVVQPIFVLELPMTLLIASYAFRSRLPHTAWYGVAAVTFGLALGLGSAAPTGGSETVNGLAWVPALIATGIFEALLIAAARRARRNARAALLGLAAACAYALTAALLKDAVARLDQGAGIAAFFSSWQLYATAVAGIGALFLLQNALQAGSLVASQPMLTLGDALISITFGVTLFGESVRTGWWLLPELIAVALITAGCLELARSPLAGGTSPVKRRVR